MADRANDILLSALTWDADSLKRNQGYLLAISDFDAFFNQESE